MVKLQEIKETVNSMPEGSTMDDVIERLIYLQQIEDAMEAIDKGEGISDKVVRENFMQKWSKK